LEARLAETAQPAAAQLSWSRIARRVRVPLGFVFAAFYFWRARPNWVSLIIGAVITGIGVGLRALASGHVRKNQELTTTGPYAYVRNPLYLGSIIVAVGFAIASRDLWIALVIVLLFVLVYVPVIRSEEVFLRNHFPEFERYARTVPRFVPRRFWLAGITNNFSRDLYLKHREYNALFGAAAMLAALVAKMLWFRG
jgi:protein-S-isoprenylcysteine O-methyltransferase Ste14